MVQHAQREWFSTPQIEISTSKKIYVKAVTSIFTKTK